MTRGPKGWNHQGPDAPPSEGSRRACGPWGSWSPASTGPRPQPRRQPTRGWDALTHTLGAGALAASASAVLYVGLGVWVWTLEPRTRRTSLLGAFALLLGLAFLPALLLPVLAPGGPPRPLVAALRAPVAAAAWAAALGLALTIPEPLEDRRLLGAALAAGLGLAFAGAGLAVSAGGFVAAPAGWAHLWTAAAGHGLGFGLLYVASALLALRAHPERGADPGQVAGLGILAVALALPAALPAGMAVPAAGRAFASADIPATLAAAAAPVAWIALAGLWGRNMVAAGGEAQARLHRLAFHGLLGALAAGALLQVAASNTLPGFTPADNLVALAGAGLLAYGLLRHDLAGHDVTLRWGTSRPALAGLAVAAFLVATQAALLLGADPGPSLHVGLLTTVAALAAWRRLDPAAERVVRRSGRGSGPGAPAARSRAETVEDRRPVVIYKALVRRFVDDGDLTRDEERALANLAQQLDLDPGRAFAIRMEEGLDEGPGRVAVGGGSGLEPDEDSEAEAGSTPDAGRDAEARESGAAVARVVPEGEDPALHGGNGDHVAAETGEDGPVEETLEAAGNGDEPAEEALAGEDPGATGSNGAPATGSEDEVEGGSQARDDASVDDGAEATADAGPAAPGANGGGDADGGASDGNGSGSESSRRRMDLRRSDETGEVELVIRETPWGEVRVDLGDGAEGE